MAVLNLLNIPEAFHRRLRMRAARHGRSMESEAKDILQRACRPQPHAPLALQAWVAKLYAGEPPRGVVDDLIAERRREAERE